MLLTVACALAGLAVAANLMSFPFAFKTMVDAYGMAYVVVWSFFAGVRVAGIVGLWQLRRWGLYLYGGQYVASLVVPLVFAISVPFWRLLGGSVLPVLILATAVLYRPRLR